LGASHGKRPPAMRLPHSTWLYCPTRPYPCNSKATGSAWIQQSAFTAERHIVDIFFSHPYSTAQLPNPLPLADKPASGGLPAAERCRRIQLDVVAGDAALLEARGEHGEDR
jgi:hypothetical protein